MLQYPILQVADTTTFSVYRRSNGQVFELPVDQYLNIGELSEGFIYNTQPLTLAASLPNTGVVRNKIDSVYVQASIQFTSGCFNFDTMLVCIYPNFDTTETVGICQGESYRWSANGRTYTTSAQATEHLTSTPGCDSTVHLNLTVFDKSYTIDRIEDCRPITWIDGQTYDASTTIPTFDTTNKWNCDSTVQLEFHYLPVVAHIQSDRDFFDFDHLDAVITDVSENNDARTWILPGGLDAGVGGDERRERAREPRLADRRRERLAERADRHAPQRRQPQLARHIHLQTSLKAVTSFKSAAASAINARVTSFFIDIPLEVECRLV